MKLKLLTSLFFISFGSYAQTYVKLNGATSLLGIPGIGIEVPVSKKNEFSVGCYYVILEFSFYWKVFREAIRL